MNNNDNNKDLYPGTHQEFQFLMNNLMRNFTTKASQNTHGRLPSKQLN